MNDLHKVIETIEVDIKGTFDVAVARNQLRKISENIQLPTILRARSAAVISTVSELVLFKSTGDTPQLRLSISFIETNDKSGVEFECIAPFTNDIAKNFPVAEWQLERICDELDIKQHGSDDLLTIRLWW